MSFEHVFEQGDCRWSRCGRPLPPPPHAGAGSWAAVVGMPDLGLLAAAELGVVLHRLVLVPRPGTELGAVVAALLDGVDLVVVATDGIALLRSRGAGLARRLSARARHRGAV